MISRVRARPQGSQRNRQWARQRGVGIIEALVALVVVSLGVLGMASLQLTGMKHSTSGYNRSKALLYAENMATRMRINTPAVDNLAYAAYDSDTTNCAVAPTQYCQAKTGGAPVAQCTVDQLAALDLFTVACGDVGTGAAAGGVEDELPQGRLQVSCDVSPCVPDATHTITVTWQEGRSATGSDEVQDQRRVQVKLQP